MKISGIVYMLITNTFILWNPHLPPQQPQSEARLSCKQGWRPPCKFWPLQPRSWHWGRQGCYECIYWPVSQIRSTWNILKDYNLVSWEARFPWDSGPSGWPSERPGWFWLCGRGSVLLEHVGTFSGNSLHPGLHHGVKDLYVLLGVDPLPPCQRRGVGGMTLPLLEMTPRTMTEAENLVFLSRRSDISLFSILVLVQNFLQTVNQRPVHL